MQPPIAEKHAFEVGTHQPSTVSPEKVNLDKSKAQTNVLLALTNVLFLKANISRRFFKGSSQKFAHRGQTKQLSYGILPPPSLLKRKCDRQWEQCMADGYAHYPRSSPQPAQTMSSVSRRDASLEVQHPLQNEQGDNLEQSNKIRFLLFFSFSARSKAGGWCSSTVSNWSECLSLPI